MPHRLPRRSFPPAVRTCANQGQPHRRATSSPALGASSEAVRVYGQECRAEATAASFGFLMLRGRMLKMRWKRRPDNSTWGDYGVNWVA